jgi:threonine/homoserine/homoserine lactone efflux protein
MELAHILAFNITLLAAIVSPGPALLIAIKTSLSSGRKAGIIIGVGLGLAASLWTLAALLGLEVIFLAFPWAYTAVKLAGAAYLIYIAYNLWTSAGEPVENHVRPAARSFRQGVVVNFLNPKSVLFAAAVLVIIFPSGMTMTENLIIVVNHFIIEVLFYAVLAYAMSSISVSQSYMKAKTNIDKISAGVLGLLGLKLIFDR